MLLSPGEDMQLTLLIVSIFTLTLWMAFVPSKGGDIPGETVRKNKRTSKELINTIIRQKLTLFRKKSKIETIFGPNFNQTLERNLGKDEVDLNLVKEHFIAAFSHPRAISSDRKNLKPVTTEYIIYQFMSYGLLVMQQKFITKQKEPGVNIIGILAGKHRNTKKDKILVIGGHYDTVNYCPGVIDNGSGSIAVLESARLLSLKNKTKPSDITIIFVAFDWEETGLEGSIAFVIDFLVSKEINQKKASFIGAYIIDMMMVYDVDPKSQYFTTSMRNIAPDIVSDVESHGSRGDFVSSWSRSIHDEMLVRFLKESWKRTNSSLPVKFYSFEGPIPLFIDTMDLFWEMQVYCPDFAMSDHASFWLQGSFGLFVETNIITLKALLLFDMGPYRSYQRQCYHKPCDDMSHLREANYLFFAKVVNALVDTVVSIPEDVPTDTYRYKEVKCEVTTLFITILSFLSLFISLAVFCFLYFCC